MDTNEGFAEGLASIPSRLPRFEQLTAAALMPRNVCFCEPGWPDRECPAHFDADGVEFRKEFTPETLRDLLAYVRLLEETDVARAALHRHMQERLAFLEEEVETLSSVLGGGSGIG